MNKTDSPRWTQLSIGTFIILLVLYLSVIIYGFMMGLLWAAGAAMLYIVFIPLIFFIDIKTKRNPYIIFLAQLFILIPVYYIFNYLANLYLVPSSGLYSIAILVFAFALLFAGGIVYLILQKSSTFQKNQGD